MICKSFFGKDISRLLSLSVRRMTIRDERDYFEEILMETKGKFFFSL